MFLDILHESYEFLFITMKQIYIISVRFCNVVGLF